MFIRQLKRQIEANVAVFEIIFKAIINSCMILRNSISFLFSMTFKRSVFFAFSKMHILQYQNFFKEIQKAHAPQQAITIYNLYRSKGGEHHKYLSTTFRILARLLRQREDCQIQYIKTFFHQKMQQINQIDLNQMEMQDLKNIIVFFLKYKETKSQISHSEQQLISNLVSNFIKFYTNAITEQKVDYFRIFVSCMKLVHLYCPHLNKQYYETILAIVIKHKDMFIRDDMTFINILNSLQQTFALSNPHQRRFISSFVKIIIHSNPATVFQEHGLTTIMSTMNAIKNKQILLSQQTKSINQLLNVVEKHLLANIHTFSIRILQTLVFDLLRQNKRSKIITRYFELTVLSIDTKGETCINPLINIFALPYLKKQDAYLLDRCSDGWQNRLILFFNRYFNRNNKFKKNIGSWIRQIITSRLMKWSNIQRLYQFYSNQYNYPKQQAALSIFSTLLQNVYISALMLENETSVNLLNQLREYLQRLQFILKYRERKLADSLISWQPLPLFIEKIKLSPTVKFGAINKKGKQPPFSNNRFDKSGKITKSQLLLEHTYNVLIMQIRLFYLNGLSKQIPSLLISQKVNNIAANQRSKQKMIKTVLFETKIQADHYETLFKWLVTFYSHSYQKLQEAIYDLIYEQSLDRQYEFDYYSTSILYYFYKSYSEANLHKLLFVSDDLLTKIFLLNRDEVVELVFSAIHRNPRQLLKYRQIIYQILNKSFQYHVDCAFYKPGSIIKKLFSITHLMDRSFVETLIHFCIQNHIFTIKSHSYLIDEIIKKNNTSEGGQKMQTFKYFQSRFRQQLKKEDQIIYDVLNSQNIKDSLKNMESALDQSKRVFSARQSNIQPYSDDVLSLHINFIRRLQEVGLLSSFQSVLITKIVKQLIVRGLIEPETKQYAKLQIFKIMIDNHIYCKQLTHDHFGYFHSSLQIRPHMFLLFAAQYPILKQDSLIADNLQHFAVNSRENLYSFLLIYALIDNPSQRITDFMKKLIKPQSQNLPLFFIIYLESFHQSIYQKLLLSPQNQDRRPFYNKDKQFITVEYKTMQKLFLNPKVTLDDFYDINLNEKRDGCHKMIIRRILKKVQPQKQIIFLQRASQQKDNRKFFGSKSKDK